MSRSRREFDDEDDFDDDFDAEDEVDGYGDDDDAEVDLLPCPHCGAAIYEESEQCPRCGEFVGPAASHAAGKPLWIVLTLALLVGIFVFYALNGW